jgi:2-polyprenyl-3-methyl-5-hydroxy-6-metoxy-1,4-benzoquinol methylase
MSDAHDAKRLEETRQYWNEQAATFDDEPDHGLRSPAVREAWAALLKKWLPNPGVAILDIGCGTGSLSILLAGFGHVVTGIDLSPEMVSRATAKATAAGYATDFHVMDAAYPQFPPQAFDVLICRHLLWALPDPEAVLQRWIALLKPKGRLILIEGYWGTAVGLHAQEILKILPSSLKQVSLQNLSGDPAYWGRVVTDERYAIVADKTPSASGF